MELIAQTPHGTGRYGQAQAAATAPGRGAEEVRGGPGRQLDERTGLNQMGGPPPRGRARQGAPSSPADDRPPLLRRLGAGHAWQRQQGATMATRARQTAGPARERTHPRPRRTRRHASRSREEAPFLRETPSRSRRRRRTRHASPRERWRRRRTSGFTESRRQTPGDARGPPLRHAASSGTPGTWGAPGPWALPPRDGQGGGHRAPTVVAPGLCRPPGQRNRSGLHC